MSTEGSKGLTITISSGFGWDEYVLKHPGSFFYHLYGWGVAFEEVFKFKKYYLEAKTGGKTCGILPLILARTPFGKKLVSIPIGVYAGSISDEASISLKLIDKAIELTKGLGCDYLELRNIKKIETDLPSKELYTTFIKQLPAKAEECLSQMPRKARAAARHAIDSGLSYEVDTKYLDESYAIYAASQRNLGSPVVPKRWFEELARVFKDKTNVLVVKHNGKCIASVLTFFYKDTVLPFYGGALPGYEKYNPNNFMYLKLQEYGVEKGYKFFDFGRSRKDAGSYHFKVNQGFEPTQLYYQYYLNKARAIPDISPSNKTFDMVKNIWRHLPLSVANRLGPALFKYVMP